MKSVDYFNTASEWILETIFPRRCLGCRAFTPQPVPYLCRTCRHTIPLRARTECIGCNIEVSEGKTCPQCRPSYAVDQLFIASNYNHPLLKRAISAMKYQYIEDLLPSLGLVLRDFITKQAIRGQSLLSNNPIIVPVPLHPHRERWRGFNQADILAQSLAHFYAVPFSAALTRTQHTTPQAHQESREARLTALEHAFACTQPESIQGKSILLVDDVCTTGTTLNECAKVLKSNGAISVTALVLARG